MMNGIDISNYQNGINLDVVPCDFVICKATEGTYYVNPDCDRAYQQAKKNGKCLGVYHYANGGDVQAEADFFINNCKNYIGEAILVLDWEKQNNPTFGKNDFIWVKSWLDYVYSKTGVKPLLYISKSLMSGFMNIGDYGKWIAQYANNTPTGYQDEPWNESAYSCAIRQYTSTGRLNGYSGNLDLNKFYGDREAWNKYAAKSGSTVTKPSDATPVKKTNEQIAQEVINGKWGNGDDRKNRLTQAGYDYSTIQSIINQKLQPAKKSVDEIAKEVLAGKWGNGQARINAITKAGYNYNEVQAKVNKMLKSTSKVVYHTVTYGETLSGIAAKYGTTYQRLAQINGINNPSLIYPGQKIKIR